jgi:hypothetical protein
MGWEIYLTDEVNDWLDHLLENDADSHRQVVSAVEALADAGPNLGRPRAAAPWWIGSRRPRCTT